MPITGIAGQHSSSMVMDAGFGFPPRSGFLGEVFQNKPSIHLIAAAPAPLGAFRVSRAAGTRAENCTGPDLRGL